MVRWPRNLEERRKSLLFLGKEQLFSQNSLGSRRWRREVLWGDEGKRPCRIRVEDVFFQVEMLFLNRHNTASASEYHNLRFLASVAIANCPKCLGLLFYPPPLWSVPLFLKTGKFERALLLPLLFKLGTDISSGLGRRTGATSETPAPPPPSVWVAKSQHWKRMVISTNK